jgi:WD40 repeat protein
LVAYDPVLAGIVRILDPRHQTVGTGFVISYNREQGYGLIATSTQVIELATSYPAEQSPLGKVFVVFQIDSAHTSYEASTREWLSSTKEDVCILEVRGELPSRVRALPLGLATTPEGRKVSIFGYPTTTNDFIGEWRYCEVCQPGPQQVKTGLFFLQLEALVITGGYRGAPIWDDARRKVIGMVTYVAMQDEYGRSAEAAYATPIEVLRTIYESVLIANSIQIEAPSPYHGLAPLSESDAASFFGYEEVTTRLAQKLQDHRLLTVLGSSGSGKTSVIRAGLIPKLWHGEIGGHTDWGIFSTTLSQEPFAQLEAQGLDNASKNLSESLHYWCQKRNCQRLIVIFDQFEEFLRDCPYDQQERFIKQLLEVINDSTFTTILVLKDDFYSLLARHKELMPWIEENLINVFSPTTKEKLVDIAWKHAASFGIHQDRSVLEKLYERVEKQLGQSNKKHSSFIMYYVACLAQAEQRRDQGVLQEADIDAIPVSLNDWAEEIYGHLSEQEQAFAKHVFTQVVLLGDESQGERDTRRRIWIASLCKEEKEVEEYDLVCRLAEKGLLAIDRDKRTGKERVTLAQDALLHEWIRLREWIDEYRQFLSWGQRFQERQEAWFQSNPDDIDERNEDTLLHDFELAEAEIWLAKCPAAIDQQTQDFIRASQQQIQQSYPISYEEAKRQQEESERQQQLALAHELSDQAMIFMQQPSQTQRGIELAVEALSHAHCPEADQALRRGLLLLSHPIAHISADNSLAISFSYDGRYVAIAREDLHIDIVELATGQVRSRFPHTTPVTLMAFDYTTTYLATVDKNRAVSVWEIPNGVRRFTYHEAHNPIMVKFSLDGRYLAVVNWDETNTIIKVWEVNPWRHHSKLIESEYVNTIDFNHNNTLLAVGGRNGTIRVWMIAIEKGILALKAPSAVNQVVFSPGGQYLAIGTELGTVVSNMDSPDLDRPNLLLNDRYKASVRTLLFSPEGNYIASGSNDGVVRIWDIPSGRKLAQLPHSSSVRAVAFSFDSTYLATTTADQGVRIWEIGTFQEIAQLPHEQPIWNVIFSMDRRYLFTLSDDRIIRAWKAIKSSQCTSFTCLAPITTVACSTRDDTLYLAASCANNTLWQWQIDHHNERQILTSTYQIQVCSLAYSSDERYLATASADGKIKFWDIMQAQAIGGFSCKRDVIGISFCHDNDYLAVIGKDGIIQTRNWKEKSITSTIKLNIEHPIHDITLSPDERYIGTAENDGTAHIWAWRVSGVDLLFELPHTHAVSGIRFSPDGNTIATISKDYKAYLWDSLDGSLLFTLEHEDEIPAITFSPDGRYIATVSEDQHAKIWEIATGRLVSDLPQKAGIHTVTFSPDGMYLVTGNKDGIVSVWLWRPEDLIYEVFTHVTPDLMEEEWQQPLEDEAD